MVLEQDIQKGKFTISGGAQVQDGTGTQNLHQALDYTHQPLSNEMALTVVPAVVAGVKSTSTSNNAVLMVTASQDGEGKIALKVDNTASAYTPSSPTATSVGVASASAVAANTSRRYLLLVNTSANSISLGLGVAAVLNSGITLNALGGSYEMTERAGNIYRGAINAIAGGAASNLAIQEGV